jgi:ATP-dependent RNA helicase DHX33
LGALILIQYSTVKASRTVLAFLGALDGDGHITPVGRQMAKLPLAPSLARALVESKEQGCTEQIIDIVSLLSSTSKIFFDVKDSDGPNGNGRDTALEARSKFFHRSGDHLTLLNVFSAWDDLKQSSKKSDLANGTNGTNRLQDDDDEKSGEGGGGINKSQQKEWCRRQFINERALTEADKMTEADKIRKQIREACKGIGLDVNLSCEGRGRGGDGNDYEPVLKSLHRGLVHNAALKQADGSYKQMQTVGFIHPIFHFCSSFFLIS